MNNVVRLVSIYQNNNRRIFWGSNPLPTGKSSNSRVGDFEQDIRKYSGNSYL